jgi:tape measure domain-containing protein
VTDRVIRVVIDPRAAVAGANTANAALSSIAQRANAAGNSTSGFGQTLILTGSAANQMARQMQAANNNAGSMGRSVGNLSGGLSGLASRLGNVNGLMAGFIGGLAAGAVQMLTTAVFGLVSGFTSLSDASSNIDAKLNLATASFGSLAQAHKDVRAVSAATRSDLTATTDLYSTLARSASTLGLTQGQVAAATKTVGMAMKISGADTNAAAGAIRQLSQALASGVLRGDEFNSIAEASPRLMQLLADSMKIPLGSLRGLAAEGKLTADKLTKALTDPKMIAKIEAEFGKIPVTFGDIKTAAGNAAIDIIGAFAGGLNLAPSLASFTASVQSMGEKVGPVFRSIGETIRAAFDGVSTVLGPVFSLISSNLSTIVPLLKAAAAGFVALRVVMMMQGAAGAIMGAVGPVIALQRAMGATGTTSAIFSAGMKMAQGAVNGLTAAIAANPIGALAVVITATVALLYQFRDAINIGGGNLASLGDLGRASFEMIGEGLSSLMTGTSEVLSSIGKGFSDLWTDATKAMGPVWSGIASGFASFRDVAGGVLSSVDGAFGGAFSAIGSKVSGLFDGIDFSFAGFLRLSARVLDLVVGHFRGAFGMMKVIWGNLPQAFTSIFALAVNGAATVIEKFINGTIGAINQVLGFANRLGATFGTIGTVKLDRADTGGAAAMGRQLGAAYTAGFGNEAEGTVDKLFNRANDIGNQRKHGFAPKAEVAPTVKPTPAPKVDDKKKKKEADEAAARLKAINEYWKVLDQSVELAKMLPLEAERHTKWLELQKIYGDKLSEQDKIALELAKGKIAAKLQEIATGKAITSMAEKTRQLSLENGLLDKRKLGLTDQQLAVEEALFGTRLDALKAGVDISTKDYAIAEAALKKELERNVAIKARGDLAKEAASIASSYSPRFDADQRVKAIEAERVKFKAAYDAGVTIDGQKISADLYKAVMTGMNQSIRDISAEFGNRMTDTIYHLADAFGGAFGRILSGFARAGQSIQDMSSGKFTGIAGAIKSFAGTKKDGTNNALGQGLQDGATRFSDNLSKMFKSPLGSMTASFDGFKTDMKSIFGKGGDFAKGMGNVIGAAAGGVETGTQMDGLMKGLGLKTSKLGSQIGGGIGGAVLGPLGAIGGSIIGGLVGGMFKKAKWGTSVVTGQNAAGISTSGNSGSRKEYASGAASSIQDGLQGLADSFGVMVGNYNVSIGTYKDKWRVSTTGCEGKLKGGSGRSDIKDFGKDGQAEAIEYAIRNAISDGALTGLKAFTQRVLNDGNYSLDSAVSLATSYENALKELAAIDDPVKASVKDILDPIDQLITKMRAAGATVSEVADIERLRSEKLKQLTEQQLSGLKDFKDQLSGQGSGITAMSQLSTKMAEFDAMKAQIASGKTVDQDVFTKLGQDIFGLSRDIYGTANSAFQDIRLDLIAVTDMFAQNVTSQVNAAAGIVVDTSSTDAAVQQQTATLSAGIATSNSILENIAAGIAAMNSAMAANNNNNLGRVVGGLGTGSNGKR